MKKIVSFYQSVSEHTCSWMWHYAWSDYIKFKPQAIEVAKRAFDSLAAENDVVVLEGAFERAHPLLDVVTLLALSSGVGGGAACNVKRWIRLEAWKLRQAMLAGSAVARATAG